MTAERSQPGSRSVAPEAVHFGDFRVDPARREVYRGEERIELQPLHFDLLAYLVAARDRVVPRDELIDSVWQGAHVTGGAVSTAIYALRSALRDDAATQAIIRTVRGRGFRFVAEVETRNRAGVSAEVAAPACETAGLPPELLPLVGRDEILGRLLACAKEAASGRGWVVLVEGESGIGKSRLVQELARLAADLDATTGFCYRESGAPSFWPWIQILRELESKGAIPAEGADDTLLHVLMRKVRAAPRSATLEPEADRFRLLDAISEAILGAARRAPRLLVIEDLHWADAASVALLRFLAPQVGRRALLLVATMRDTEVDEFGPITPTLGALATHPHAMRIALQGLGRADTASILETVVGAPPDDALLDRVVENSRGNPFFVRELAQLLREGRDGGEETALPRAVREALRQRFGHLSPRTLRILRIASVIGPEFDVELLEEMLEEGGGERSWIDEARRSRILDATATTGHLRFAHRLTLQALYEELGFEERAAVHLRLARALERRTEGAASPPHGLLAYHFEAAIPATGSPDKAIEHALRASERAAVLSGLDEVLRHSERVLDLLERCDPGPRRDDRELHAIILRIPALVASRGYESDEADDLLDRAEKLALRLGDADRLRLVVAIRYLRLSMCARHREALDLIERVEFPNPSMERARAIARGMECFFQGRFDLARRCCEAAGAAVDDDSVRAFSRLAGQDIVTTGRMAGAIASWLLGEPERAVELFESGLSRARDSGDAYGEAVAFYYAALYHDLRRSPADVLDAANRLDRVCRERGVEIFSEPARLWREWAERAIGADPSDAGDDAPPSRREIGPTRKAFLPYHLSVYARTCAREDGLGYLEAARSLAEQHDERFYLSAIQCAQGRILIGLSRLDEARTCLEAALETALAQRSPVFELRVRLEQARLHAADAAFVDVRPHLEALARRLGPRIAPADREELAERL